MANFVQMYKSTDLNAPVLTGQVGSLITLLNKCLVDGYTTAAVSGIVESGTNYTVTLGSANTTLNPAGQYITIAGASPAGMNGTWRINTYTDSTHVIITGPGGLGAITGGAITYAKAGLQWTKPFAAGTNSQTYRSADAASNQLYLQVIDNAATAGGAKEAQIYGAEAMSADQTVTSGQFPTAVQYANGLCFRKSTTADATARAWTLFGDDKTFYLIPNTGDAAVQSFSTMGFGHFISFKSGDAFNTFIGGGATFNSASSVVFGLNANRSPVAFTPVTTDALFAPRLYSQAGTAIPLALQSFSGNATVFGGSTYGFLTYPLPSDNGLIVNPVFVCDANGNLRGRLPGIFPPIHNAPLTQYDESTGVSGLPSATLVALTVTTGGLSGQINVDKYGPWN